MAIPICILTPQGAVDAPYSAPSLAEAAAQEPDGVYTVARTYEGHKALLLNEHLDRLERSAKLEGITVTLDRQALRSALRTLIMGSGYPDSRFRLTIPREHPDQVIISLEPFKPVPQEVLEHGARVITVQMERHNPIAKTTAWAAARKDTVEHFPVGIYEGILITADGLLLEGTSSNFYAVLDGMLHTAGDDLVLSGMARRIVLTVSPDVILVQKTPVTSDQISALSEAMLSSAGRGVVPIVEIDGHKIGDGTPGLITRGIRARYEAWATAHLEEI